MSKIEAIIARTSLPTQNSQPKSSPRLCPKSAPSSNPTPIGLSRHSSNESSLKNTTYGCEYSFT